MNATQDVTRRVAAVASIALIVAVGAGCGFKLRQSYPKKRRFGLDAARLDRPTRAPIGSTLAVRRFTISPMSEGRGFVYKTGDTTYVADYYNEFLAPPADAIADQARKWLAASGLFEDVIPAASLVRPAYTLEGSIEALYGDFSDRRAPKAILETRVFLIRNNAQEPAVVFNRLYVHKAPLSEATADDLARGWRRALRQTLTDLEADLAKLRLE